MYGVVWGTGFVPPAIPSTVNPTPIWRATFTMPTAPVTLNLQPAGLVGVWAGPHSSGFAAVATAPATGAQVTIALVPGPAAWSVVVGGGLVLARRRRTASWRW